MNIKKFIELEKKMAAGEDLAIRLDSPSHSLVSHYMRAWRGRSDLSRVVQQGQVDQDFTSTLNTIRDLIRQDKLELALGLIQSTPAKDTMEKIELGLESCRCDLFKKNYEAVIQASDLILKNPETPESTRMTLYQIRGIAKTYSGQMQSALEDLDIALTIAATLPTAPSAFAALTVKAQAYACLGDQTKSDECLRLARSILDSTIDSDMWLERMLSFLRAQVRFNYYFASEYEFLKSVSLARCIAEWLGAKVVVRLCDDDLAGQSAPSVSYRFLGGQYLPDLKVLLTDVPRSVTCLDDAPQASQIIELLCQKDFSKAELFEAVWGYAYNENIHNGHLRNTFSRIRKFLPEGTLVSEKNKITLKK